ncbi:recombinase family protein [Paracoccus alkenifer]|uniref:recombinase family protein n=1 Tax=Paracoccus alkenifer TaxID=65735 RepID=UPI000B80F5BF
MPAAALYARYSSDLQNPCSVDDQLNLCREYAARQGWTVVSCYHDEAVSGAAIRGRNGAIRMLEDASARRF